jgi:predicted acylesterase/phospholipase RssA
MMPVMRMDSDPGLQVGRDHHLFGTGPKRILALDGGGVRGIVSTAFLERLEEVIASIEGRPILLGDWFDLVGGTSTGAIIAAAVALGFRATEIRRLYEELAPRVFRRSSYRFFGRHSVFDAASLRRELTNIMGSRTLDSEDLRTGFGVVTKRMDTGSTWIVLNNPRSPYWNSPDDKSFIGNRHYSLANLVRASTAAPHYFDPEFIEIAEGSAPGLFIDGGLSPHNNPALYLFLSVALPSFQIGWPLGSENLTIISIGTGSFRHTISTSELPWLRSFGMALHALMGQVSDSQQMVLALMSWLGHSPAVWRINAELGDLGSIPPPFNQPLFRFLRFDISLEHEWLASALGRSFDPSATASLRDLSAVKNMKVLYELAAEAAHRQIVPEHVRPRGPAQR